MLVRKQGARGVGIDSYRTKHVSIDLYNVYFLQSSLLYIEYRKVAYGLKMACFGFSCGLLLEKGAKLSL